ncbi:DUF5063 domain-containing protein [Archangium sp. Cb G35]|uniref:DUF5063 domain-containing protein n=1 Tax=Archangium sp. Cb G35 TaxID=1920190 RepID=UPI0009370BF3|nr:DUF5063 domain-containing protein [Archangium sp. Cb G35]OJT24425.1 DUF5063 domain-containing protein [Archangium sp. Cb G35]
MTRGEILDAVKQFLSLMEGAGPAEKREETLRLVLDRLALAYHFAEAPSDDRDYPAPPRAEYRVLRERISPLFPRYGFYNVALDVTDLEGEPENGIADAIDDLTDIAMDLHEVLARWEMTSEEDALFHFRFLFESHWGHHLRSLQLYLHALAF